MPQRMHSSRLVYVTNKISEQNDTALLSYYSSLSQYRYVAKEVTQAKEKYGFLFLEEARNF